MRFLTVREALSDSSGVVWAGELPGLLQGRPKDFPPLEVVIKHDEGYLDRKSVV